MDPWLGKAFLTVNKKPYFIDKFVMAQVLVINVLERFTVMLWTMSKMMTWEKFIHLRFLIFTFSPTGEHMKAIKLEKEDVSGE